MLIRPLTIEDWTAVADIYAQGIATGLATFETAVPDWPHFDAACRPDCRLVAERGGAVCGWAVLKPTSARAVYRGVTELTIYVAGAYRGLGVGKQLLSVLIPLSESYGIWTIQASVFRENLASVGLLRSQGFRTVGHRERVAQLHGRWRDTLILERRSPAL